MRQLISQNDASYLPDLIRLRLAATARLEVQDFFDVVTTEDMITSATAPLGEAEVPEQCTYVVESQRMVDCTTQ